MASREKTITLVITEEIDTMFREVVAEKIGGQHGVLKQAIIEALKHYAYGLSDGTIKPFVFTKLKKKSKALSYKDQEHSKDYTGHLPPIAWTNPQQSKQNNIPAIQGITSVEQIKQTSPFPMNQPLSNSLSGLSSSQLQSGLNAFGNSYTQPPTLIDTKELSHENLNNVNTPNDPKDNSSDIVDSEDITPICSTEPEDKSNEDPLDLHQYDTLSYDQLLEECNKLTDTNNDDQMKVREYIINLMTKIIERSNNNPQ